MGGNSHFGHLGELEAKKKREESSSAEEGEVALPAAHLAAHGGQYVINVPSGQPGAQAASAAAYSLQAALLPCGRTWNNKTHLTLKKTSDTKKTPHFWHCSNLFQKVYTQSLQMSVFVERD